MARLCPLFSGSTGNSYYIGTKSSGVLIDVGRSARQVENMLKLCGIDPLAVGGILITHEHSDHISGVRVLAKKYGLPVFASPGTLRAMAKDLEGIESYVAQPGLALASVTVHPFATSHDSAQSLGFRIETEDKRVFTLATDLGYLSDEVKAHLFESDMAVIESNHDVQMLRNGGYPMYLKARILSSRGHLSNAACGEFLPELLKSGTRRFLLAHLSRENNTPALARDTALTALTKAGYVQNVDYMLEVAPPENTAGRSILF